MFSKTTLLNLSPSPTYFPPFLIDNILIFPSPTASNLGVHPILFDYNISFNPHITVITKSANYHLFRIGKIRKSITTSLTKTLINSLILSRIDYYSSLLTNLPLSSTSSRVIRSDGHRSFFPGSPIPIPILYLFSYAILFPIPIFNSLPDPFPDPDPKFLTRSRSESRSRL